MAGSMISGRRSIAGGRRNENLYQNHDGSSFHWGNLCIPSSAYPSCLASLESCESMRRPSHSSHLLPVETPGNPCVVTSSERSLKPHLPVNQVKRIPSASRLKAIPIKPFRSV